MTETTAAALSALLAELIDYAGLFPPANLLLTKALANYSRYRNEADAWMLGRFVIPVGRLPEVTSSQLALGDPFRFAVIGRGGGNAAEFLDKLAEDVAAIEQFVTEHAGRVTVDLLEVRLPRGIANERAELRPLLAQAAAQLPATLMPFYEVPYGTGWLGQMETAVAAIATRAGTAGFKLRCGGVTPEAFPTIGEVAAALYACREAAVPLKCTAGLHHPVRQFRAEVGTEMHGFLNVFGAAVLSYTAGLSLADVAAVLAEGDGREFIFDDDVFAWRNFHATTAEIRFLRTNLITSFGSCSFDEPRTDLVALDLI